MTQSLIEKLERHVTYAGNLILPWKMAQEIIQQHTEAQVDDFHDNLFRAIKVTLDGIDGSCATNLGRTGHIMNAISPYLRSQPQAQMNESVYKKFFDEIWGKFCDTEFGEAGEDIADLAVKLGLATQEEYDPEKHGDYLAAEWGVEKGDMCYIKAEPSPQAQPTEDVVEAVKIAIHAAAKRIWKNTGFTDRFLNEITTAAIAAYEEKKHG